jgi:hypothetical protein
MASAAGATTSAATRRKLACASVNASLKLTAPMSPWASITAWPASANASALPPATRSAAQSADAASACNGAGASPSSSCSISSRAKLAVIASTANTNASRRSTSVPAPPSVASCVSAASRSALTQASS